MSEGVWWKRGPDVARWVGGGQEGQSGLLKRGSGDGVGREKHWGGEDRLAII